MGTRSLIAIANPKGDYSAIYCHWDGYPENMGAMLRDNYSVKSKARALIRLGHCSAIYKNLAPTGAHSFNAPESGVTIAYGRDRGDKDCGAEKPQSFAELASLADNMCCEYIYILDCGRWHYLPTGKALAGKNPIAL